MAITKLRILLLDLAGESARALAEELLPRVDPSFELVQTSTLGDAIEKLTDDTFHVVLLHVAADRTGLDVLEVVHELSPHTPVIVLTDYSGLVVSDDATRKGAAACLCAETIGPHGLAYAIRFAVEKNKRKRLERVLDASRLEMRIARSIQERLLPWVPPMIPGARVAGASTPADSVSGDYFDYLTLPDGRFALAVGDASGHGLGPAMLMAEIRTCLRAFVLNMHDPGDILNATNDLLAGTMPDNRFVTLLLMCFDEEMATVSYASAGHPPACVLKGNGSTHVKRLEATGMPIGVEEGLIETKRASIDTGDLVLALSDGILEAHHTPRNQFGFDRTIDLVTEHRQSDPVDIINRLNDAVRAFCEPSSPPDDMTSVVLKVEA